MIDRFEERISMIQNLAGSNSVDNQIAIVQALCEIARQCRNEPKDRRHRRVYHVSTCSIHGIRQRDTCPICDQPMQTIALVRLKRDRTSAPFAGLLEALEQADTHVQASFVSGKESPMSYESDIQTPESDTPILPNSKQLLDIANKLLARIAVVCSAALDPELSREQVIGRLKYIYSLAVFDDEKDESPGVAEGP